MDLFRSIVTAACVGIVAVLSVKGQERSTDVRSVISVSEGVQVISVKPQSPTDGTIDGTTNDDTAASLSLRNHTHKAITAIALAGGPAKASAMQANVSDPSGQYHILANPDEVFIIRFIPKDFPPDFPIRVGAVIFEDGSTTGEDFTIKYLKEAVAKTRKQ